VYRLMTCLTTEHDLRIVMVAVLTCAATAATAFKTYAHALDCVGRRRVFWTAITGFSAASGIWGTHFIAMLAYQPRIATAYSPELTAISLLLACIATTAGFLISSGKTSRAVTIGGGIIGAGIGVMHFTGMQALEVAGHVEWDHAMSLFAAALGIGFSIAAMRAFHPLERNKMRPALASVLLVIAIASTHFTAMAAAQIIPNPSIEIDVAGIDRVTLAIGLFFVSALTLMAGIFAAFNSRIKTQLEVRTSHLRYQGEDRRLAAERTTKQQAIVSEIMRSEKFRHESLHDAMEVLNTLATTYSKIDVSYIYHVSKDGLTLVPFHSHDRRSNQKFGISAVPTHYFVENGNMDSMKDPAFFSDLQSDPRIAESRLEYTKARDMHAAIDMPIEMDGHVVGVYCVRACGAVHEWTQDEKSFVTALGNLASLAFERDARQSIADELRTANAASQAATKAKSQFLANMSHEIRTPMNGVFGMTDLLARTELNDRQRRLVDNIGQSARTLLTIINDILDLSRIEEGKLSLDSHEYDLAGCVEDSVALLAEDAQKKGLELNLYVHDDAVGTATGDSVRLRQIMINLIGNAVKFTSKGEIAIRVTPVGEEKPAKRFKFEVRDTGIGIDAASLERLFKPFTQADSSISRRYGGTGLGLSISQHLVVLMGGEIQISSEPGVGTVISFELPLNLTAKPDARIKTSAELLSGQRILVVDDRAANREIVCSYLAACGVQAEAAENGAQALDMLEAAAKSGKPFVQAIVDQVMPGMDGLELCRRTKANPDLQSTQLILLSSLSWSQDLSVARDAGVERLLHKPIRRNELVSIVTELLNRHQKPTSLCGEAKAPVRGETISLNLKVLVAEDNPVNQVIASEYLANLGCSVLVADNGLQAVAAHHQQKFDCILMDCQMPEMDGLQATRIIRERERETNAEATPIIAVTANAYEEDRLRCLEAGMDGYVSKPFSEDNLSAALIQWCVRAKEAASSNITSLAEVRQSEMALPDAQVRSALNCAIIDSTMKTARPALYSKLIAVFLNHAGSAQQALANALRADDTHGLKAAAHSLKSSTANIGANNLSELCHDLEIAARNDEMELCRPIVNDVRQGLATLCDALQAETDLATQAESA
jgi:two-component system, sensor histidine kinase and response regulator